jgi:hypothetical protein
LFSVTASLVNGKYYEAEYSQLNKGADCGFNGFRGSSSVESNTTAGTGLSLAVVSFVLCLIQVVMYTAEHHAVGPA